MLCVLLPASGIAVCLLVPYSAVVAIRRENIDQAMAGAVPPVLIFIY